ncbi:MAG: hypothetical protein UV34_C0038G0001 [Parcubacteria group bacterium GW2011_GWB1_42_6]|nr:MAG: hypothetical protein UV34_C0038G0001 [Parcubacteria group bacterium GW2011_GWB1_42_6]
MRSAKPAFIWIISILKKRKIPFQISGGMAARVWGAKRELADIDINVDLENFDEILPEVKKFVIFGPGKYKDKNWDLYEMTLRYRGQEIDICRASDQKIFNKNTKKWESLRIDFSTSRNKKVFGLPVSVMPKDELIDYKIKLRRPVDLKDTGGVDPHT